MSATPSVEILDALATASQGVIGTLPSLVFQQSPMITFEAFSNAGGVVVQVNTLMGNGKGTQNVNLSLESPTAQVPVSLYIGSGAVQLNDGTVSLALAADTSSVLCTCVMNIFISVPYVPAGTVGGTYYLPL